MPPTPPALNLSSLRASRTLGALQLLSGCPGCHVQRLLPLQRRSFQASRGRSQEPFPNHYDTLDLPSTASPAEIKRQFYALSKQYHPDLNKAAEASARFVRISEAYHVLGSAEKRLRYDRDRLRLSAEPQTGRRAGSYTKASTRSPAGGRQPSGLSKRRSAFRGPPPSFYARGGYGGTEPHRARAQEQADQRGYTAQRAYADHDWGDVEMPYFDREGHRRTHEGLEARRERMGGFGGGAGAGFGGGPADRRRAGPEDVGGGTDVFLFCVLSAILAGTTLIGSVVSSRPSTFGGPQSGRRGDG